MRVLQVQGSGCVTKFEQHGGPLAHSWPVDAAGDTGERLGRVGCCGEGKGIVRRTEVRRSVVGGSVAEAGADGAGESAALAMPLPRRVTMEALAALDAVSDPRLQAALGRRLCECFTESYGPT